MQSNIAVCVSLYTLKEAWYVEPTFWSSAVWYRSVCLISHFEKSLIRRAYMLIGRSLISKYVSPCIFERSLIRRAYILIGCSLIPKCASPCTLWKKLDTSSLHIDRLQPDTEVCVSLHTLKEAWYVEPTCWSGAAWYRSVCLLAHFQRSLIMSSALMSVTSKLPWIWTLIISYHLSIYVQRSLGHVTLITVFQSILITLWNNKSLKICDTWL